MVILTCAIIRSAIQSPNVQAWATHQNNCANPPSRKLLTEPAHKMPLMALSIGFQTIYEADAAAAPRAAACSQPSAAYSNKNMLSFYFNFEMSDMLFLRAVVPGSCFLSSTTALLNIALAFGFSLFVVIYFTASFSGEPSTAVIFCLLKLQMDTCALSLWSMGHHTTAAERVL